MHTMQLTDIVIDTGVVTPDELRIAQTESQKTGKRLEQTLISNGFVSAEQLREIHGSLDNVTTVDLKTLSPDAGALNLLDRQLARQHLVFPLYYDATSATLQLVMARANNVTALDAIQAHLTRKVTIRVVIASTADILTAIDRCYGVDLSIDGILHELDSAGGTASDTARPVVRLVDALLSDAVRRHASDLHLEPEQNALRIRYRVNGVMRQIRCLHLDYWPPMLVRIKVMAGLNIAESRAPQDGRLSLTIEGRSLDCRVSTFPCVAGECVVIRILNRSSSLLSFTELGLNDTQATSLSHIVRRPQGLILVTGPTGSGKSTTLYSVVNDIRDESLNVMTMEDPVEYQMSMVRQSSVNPSRKLDFASGIRSILRQDPDVILVGETRDQATADMLLKATLTGHLVMSTLHSLSALSAFARLQDLGVNLSHLSDNLLALIAQRLVRVLCEHCKEPTDPPNDIAFDADRPVSVYQPVGCRHCDGSGYLGRRVVMEIYQPSVEVHRLLADGATPGVLIRQAMAEGHSSLSQQGLILLQSGVTSYAELRRVINSDWAVTHADV